MRKKYKLKTHQELSFGWSFYLDRPSFISSEVRKISDTFMNNVVYSRFLDESYRDYTNDSTKVRLRLYARTDRPNTIFHVDKKFDERYNCNLVRIDEQSVYADDKNFWRNSEMEYVDRTLTTYEIEVFKQWEKNAKQNCL